MLVCFLKAWNPVFKGPILEIKFQVTIFKSGNWLQCWKSEPNYSLTNEFSKHCVVRTEKSKWGILVNYSECPNRKLFTRCWRHVMSARSLELWANLLLKGYGTSFDDMNRKKKNALQDHSTSKPANSLSKHWPDFSPRHRRIADSWY